MSELSSEELTFEVVSRHQDVRTRLQNSALYRGRELIPAETQEEARRLQTFGLNFDLKALVKVLDEGLSSEIQAKLGIKELLTPEHLAATRLNHLFLPRYVYLQDEAIQELLGDGPLTVTRCEDADLFAIAEPAGEDILPIVDRPVAGFLRTSFVELGRFSMRPARTGIHKPFYVHPLDSDGNGQIIIERN